MLSWVEHEKRFITSGPGPYWGGGSGVTSCLWDLVAHTWKIFLQIFTRKIVFVTSFPFVSHHTKPLEEDKFFPFKANPFSEEGKSVLTELPLVNISKMVTLSKKTHLSKLFYLPWEKG